VAGVVAVGLTLAASVVEARVFLRWRAGGAGTREALLASGAKEAYQAEVRLNGRKGDLKVWAFPETLAEVVRRLQGVYPEVRFEMAGSSMAEATVAIGGRTARLLAVQLDFPIQTIVFTFEQSAEDAQRGREPPGDSWPADLPSYPGSKPLLVAEDTRTRVSLAVATAPADPSAVSAFFRASLEAQGWQPALPAVSGVERKRRLEVYLKATEICCLLVEGVMPPAGSRITLLHQRQLQAY